MKNLENAIQLLVSAKNIKGTTFIGLNGYTNTQGEVSNQLIVAGISYENTLVHDFQALQNNCLAVLENEDLIKKYGQTIVEKAYGELGESLEKRLSSPEVKEALRQQNDSTILRSDAQNNAYIHLAKGVKLNKVSEEIHIFGLVERKKITTPIEYKKTNSRELTLCKNDIQKFCKFKQSKYRSFIFHKANVKLKGIEIPKEENI